MDIAEEELINELFKKQDQENNDNDNDDDCWRCKKCGAVETGGEYGLICPLCEGDYV